MTFSGRTCCLKSSDHAAVFSSALLCLQLLSVDSISLMNMQLNWARLLNFVVPIVISLSNVVIFTEVTVSMVTGDAIWLL